MYLDLSKGKYDEKLIIENLNKIITLDISDNNLTKIPDIIFKTSNLFSLNISRNKINKLPNKICKLKDLRIFNISVNNLRSLPYSIGCLINLTYLNLTNNNLYELPNTIIKLTNLLAIFISGNEQLCNLIYSFKNPQLRRLNEIIRYYSIYKIKLARKFKNVRYHKNVWPCKSASSKQNF